MKLLSCTLFACVLTKYQPRHVIKSPAQLNTTSTAVVFEMNSTPAMTRK